MSLRRTLPLLLLAACFGLSSEAPARPSWPRMPAQVAESSGLARSATFGAFWTHGDSGNEPVLHEVTTSGRLLRSVRVEGATHVDWEDIAPDGEGGVWIADCGNNANMRQDLALFHVPAAELVGEGPATVDKTWSFAFPGQNAFPTPGAMNFDCEALFVDGLPHVLTKHRSDTRTVLHVVGPDDQGVVKATPLGTFDVGGKGHPFGGMVTSADLHPSGRWLAVLTYHALFVFERPDEEGEHWLSTVVNRIELVGSRMGQTEAVSWDGSGLVLTNEDGVVFRLDDPFAPDRRFPAGPKSKEASGATP